MTNEWTDLPTLVSVCNAQTDGWEIEYGIGEDCAKLCEAEAIDRHNIPAAIVARRCADAIRARGEVK